MQGLIKKTHAAFTTAFAAVASILNLLLVPMNFLAASMLAMIMLMLMMMKMRTASI